jgi:hypothetical protein
MGVLKMTLAKLNTKMKATVSPCIELVKGEGYHYFVFDDGAAFETESVMVPYTNRITPAEWLLMAEQFAAKHIKKG